MMSIDGTRTTMMTTTMTTMTTASSSSRASTPIYSRTPTPIRRARMWSPTGSLSRAESRAESPFSPGPLSVVSFVAPSQVQRVSYRRCKGQLSRAFSDNPNFEDGLLLETLEKGVRYPVVHMAALSPRALMQSPSGQPLLMKSNSLGPDVVLKQGIYEEAKFLEPYYGELEQQRIKHRQESLDDHPLCYVFLGFTGHTWGFGSPTVGFETPSNALEDSWKDWTGVRYMYLNLPEELGLSRITLLKHRPNLTTMTTLGGGSLNNDDVGKDGGSMLLFTYIVLMEFTDVTTKKETFLTDFIQRFRAERAKGYLSIYREGVPKLSSVGSGDGYYSSGGVSDDVCSNSGSDDNLMTTNNNRRRHYRRQDSDRVFI